MKDDRNKSSQISSAGKNKKQCTANEKINSATHRKKYPLSIGRWPNTALTSLPLIEDKIDEIKGGLTPHPLAYKKTSNMDRLEFFNKNMHKSFNQITKNLLNLLQKNIDGGLNLESEEADESSETYHVIKNITGTFPSQEETVIAPSQSEPNLHQDAQTGDPTKNDKQ